MSRLIPLFPQTQDHPEWHFNKSFRLGNFQKVTLKDNFHISTWLCIGALAQGLAFLACGPIALIPSGVILIFRTIDILLMSAKIKRDRIVEGVIPKKFGAQVPNYDGKFGVNPGEKGLVVFIVGGETSHPLGILAPGVKKNTEYFEAMKKALDEHYVNNGLLGYSSWKSMDEAAGNKTIFIMYWQDVESLHRFAHGPEHMAGIRWWANDGSKKYPHIGVFHETYIVPKNHFENVYLRCKPLLMAGTAFPVFEQPAHDGDVPSERKIIGWQKPIVDSKRGPLRTFARRVQRQDMTAHEKEDGSVWDNTTLEE